MGHDLRWSCWLMTKKGGTRGMAENVDWGRKGSVLLRLLLCLFSLRGMGSIMFMFFLLFSRPRSLCVCTYLLLGHREGLEIEIVGERRAFFCFFFLRSLGSFHSFTAAIGSSLEHLSSLFQERPHHLTCFPPPVHPFWWTCSLLLGA